MNRLEITNELVDWLKNAAERGGAFVEREAPLLAGEIVAWHFWSHLLLSIVYAVAAIALAAIAVWWLNACRKWCWSPDTGPFPTGPAGAACGLGFAVACGFVFHKGFLCNALEVTKASVAPRVVIVEKLSGMSR